MLHGLEPALNQFGYLAVVAPVEDFGVPVPGETVLILGAVYAGTGRLNILLVALLGFCGRTVRHALAAISRLNAVGSALWVLVWTSVGYLSGNHIDTIYNAAARYDTYLAIAVAALLLAYIARRVIRGRRDGIPPETERPTHLAPTTLKTTTSSGGQSICGWSQPPPEA